MAGITAAATGSETGEQHGQGGPEAGQVSLPT